MAVDGARVRLLTWNVWWRFGPQWRDRQPGLLEALRSVDADVVVLVESWGTATTSQAAEFGQALGLHGVFAGTSLPPVPDPPETPDQVGVEIGLGLLSRWPITELRQVRLPSRHRQPPPIAVVATLDHPDGQLHVVAVCTEWEPAYNDDRVAQARAVADLAMAPELDGPSPVVLLGDLNAAPGSAFLRPVEDLLTDAWTAGGGDPAAITLRSDHPFAPLEAEELIDQRIDHIFFRPGRPRQSVTVDSARLAGEPVAGLDPSDHLGVVCDLRWSNAGS